MVGQDPAFVASEGEGTPKRETILPRKGRKRPGIPWQSWLLLAVTLAAGFAIFYFTFGIVLEPWLRWGVTLSWLGLTVGFSIYDLWFQTPRPGSVHETAVDRWTIVHTGAGVVFGAWYLPVWAVLLFTLFWEFFELHVKGFGDREIIQNRVVDVAVALFGWWLVVSVVMATTVPGAHFPLLTGR